MVSGKRSKVAKEHSRGAWRIRQARETGRRKRGSAESSGERKKGGGGPWYASRSLTGSRHDCGGGFGDSFSVRVELRDSIQPAASLSFSDTSRKNCAVRFSVSGATSSFTKLFTRSSSSSTRLPKSSKFLISLSFENSWSMRLPNSSNLSIVPVPRKNRR